MPCVVDVPVRKQRPRHWMFRGVVSPGTVVVIEGLQGMPSARREVTTPVESQSPRRVLHTEPEGHCAFEVQKPMQPGASGALACVNHQPVQMKPVRQAPAPEVVPGVHARVQSELSLGASPCVRQVEPEPPHIDCSVACELLLVHASVHIGCEPVGMHTSAPHAGSVPPMGSGFVHAAPAVEPVVVPDRHTPAEHVWPVAQRLPQKPQFVASVDVLVHVEPQSVLGALHVVPPWQRPLTQACALGHALPHAPQLFASNETSVQNDPHMRIGDAQPVEPPVHEPLLHVWPLAQRRPHTPQLATSLVTSTQLDPHITRGEEHDGVPP